MLKRAALAALPQALQAPLPAAFQGPVILHGKDLCTESLLYMGCAPDKKTTPDLRPAGAWPMAARVGVALPAMSQPPAYGMAGGVFLGDGVADKVSNIVQKIENAVFSSILCLLCPQMPCALSGQ